MASITNNGFNSIFKEINLEKPSDRIIQQVRNLIHSGQLNPGDKLPSERKLGEMFGMPFGNWSSMEFSRLCLKAISHLLVDTRILLETHSARLTA